jgi:hypothetical protein
MDFRDSCQQDAQSVQWLGPWPADRGTVDRLLADRSLCSTTHTAPGLVRADLAQGWIGLSVKLTSRASSAEAKSEWSCISTPSDAFISFGLTNRARTAFCLHDTVDRVGVSSRRVVQCPSPLLRWDPAICLLCVGLAGRSYQVAPQPSPYPQATLELDCR